MAVPRASIRIRASLQRDLRLLAAKRSQQCNTSITMTSLLEEGIEALFQTELAAWVAWTKEDTRERESGETSVPFRIQTDLSRKLGVLAAQISRQSDVPITKIHLTQEAGQRILAQAGTEFADMLADAGGQEYGHRKDSTKRYNQGDISKAQANTR
jgi:hypothetical protein